MEVKKKSIIVVLAKAASIYDYSFQRSAFLRRRIGKISGRGVNGCFQAILHKAFYLEKKLKIE